MARRSWPAIGGGPRHDNIHGRESSTDGVRSLTIPKQEGQWYVVESGIRGIGAAQIDQELVVSRMPGHGHFQEPSQPLG